MKRRLTEIGRGRLVGPSVERTTFDELAALLIADYRINSRKSLTRVQRSVGRLKRMFGGWRVLDNTPDQITHYIDMRRDEGAANASINRDLSALTRMFRLGEAAEKVNRFSRIRKLKDRNTRKGFVEDAQAAGLLRRFSADLLPLMDTAYITGWRIKSEVCTRQKQHVDLTHGWLRLEPGESKNEDGRMFPLTEQVRATLTAQMARTEALERATGPDHPVALSPQRTAH